MNGLALVLNFFVPGVGSIVMGKAGQGITQILLFGFGLLLTLTAILSIFGLPMMLGAWIWGLVTAIGGGGATAPQTINIVQQAGPTNSTSLGAQDSPEL